MSSQAKQTRRPPTFDHLTKKKPIELRDWIPLDGEVAGRYQEAKNNYDRAELAGDLEKLKEARITLEAADAELRECSVEVLFRAMPRKKYQALVRQFPPTERTIEEFKREYGVDAVPEYDPELLAPHLIAASCVQPEMTPEQVTSLSEEHGWNSGEIAHLFQLALRVNAQRRVVNWGN